MDSSVEIAEGDKLAATAKAASLAVLSRTTVAAAQRVIAIVADADGGAVASEPARDLRRIRTDPALMGALDQDTRTATASVRLFVSDALWMGYRRAAKTRTPGLPVAVDLTDSDREDLAGYPINGFTAGETTTQIVDALRRDVDRALALPLVGVIDPGTIPAALQAVEQTHANRVALAVNEAYHAGVAAFMRALAHALVGA